MAARAKKAMKKAREKSREKVASQGNISQGNILQCSQGG
jgi:hypothetical protein